MQGQSSAGSSFTETVDLNISNDPESRLPNYMLSSAEGNFACTNAVGHGVRSFSSWDLGESSSSANLQNQGISDGLKVENGRSPFLGTRTGSDVRVGERRFGPSNILFRESLASSIGGNQGTNIPLIMQNSSTSRTPLNINLNAGDTGSSGDSGQGLEPDACHAIYKLSGPETEHTITADDSSDNVVTCAGNFGNLVESDGGSASSLGNWGSSCKRKALEGTSGQTYLGGSSNCSQQAESFSRHGVPARYSASSSLSMSLPPVNPHSVTSSPEQLNPRIGIGMRGVASDIFPPLSMPGIAESSSRNHGVRVNLGHHESVQFNSPPTGNGIRHSDVCPSYQPSRPLSLTGSLDLRPTTLVAPSSNNPPNQSHSTHIPDLSRNMLPFPFYGAVNSRAGGSSNSLMLSGDRGASLQDDANYGSTPRSNMDPPVFVPATEMANLAQDPNGWNLPTGNASTSASVPSSSRFGPSSVIRPFPTAWIPHHNPPAQNWQRLSEIVPPAFYPSDNSDSGGQRGHFPPLHSGPSEETIMSSGANNQSHRAPYPRSALLMEVPGDDVHGWRALAADIEGRHRLVSEIRQVLNAIRRGESLRSEDYMLFDPFINGVAELHDRHRDMRLDVDNMSYEELLALEERIGNVNTGLSEEMIMKSMQQRKYFSITVGSPSNLEPCCICREEYAPGDAIGTLDCGHDFHTNCIKQWLTQKNLCPICKLTALGTT
ncbi:RING-type E3 ubiquitin transferase [Sarracenia purpurea var. burkii]